MSSDEAVAEKGLEDQVADAVRACPAVVDLATGPIGTYLPGRVLSGVAVHDDAVEVAIVAYAVAPLSEAADQVRAAVSALVPGRPVNVSIEDVVAGIREN